MELNARAIEHGEQDFLGRLHPLRCRTKFLASVIDLALPGTLTVLNRGAVERAIDWHCDRRGGRPHSIYSQEFFYLTHEGYQISQYEPGGQGRCPDVRRAAQVEIKAQVSRTEDRR